MPLALGKAVSYLKLFRRVIYPRAPCVRESFLFFGQCLLLYIRFCGELSIKTRCRCANSRKIPIFAQPMSSPLRCEGGRGQRLGGGSKRM